MYLSKDSVNFCLFFYFSNYVSYLTLRVAPIKFYLTLTQVATLTLVGIEVGGVIHVFKMKNTIKFFSSNQADCVVTIYPSSLIFGDY